MSRWWLKLKLEHFVVWALKQLCREEFQIRLLNKKFEKHKTKFWSCANTFLLLEKSKQIVLCSTKILYNLCSCPNLISYRLFQSWTHLLSNTVGHRHSTDPARLGYQDVALSPAAPSHAILQQKTRDPSCLATSCFSSNHNYPGGLHSWDHTLTVGVDRELEAQFGVRSVPSLLQVDAELLSLRFRKRPVRPACDGICYKILLFLIIPVYCLLFFCLFLFP